MSAVDVLLARLDRVTKASNGWMARCPGHDDRTNSLAVSVGDDGRVLIHDFGGCGALHIVQSIGLELRDLYDRPLATGTTEYRQRMSFAMRETLIKTALAALSFEAIVVSIAARQILGGRDLAAADVDRLLTAADRISEARAVCWPRRQSFKDVAEAANRAMSTERRAA